MSTIAPVPGPLPLPGGEVRRAHRDDAAELLVLQRCCWVQEAIANETLAIVALRETLSDVQDWIESWSVWCVRREGRLVAAVRAKKIAATWEIGRLMVSPDLQGHHLGRWLLNFAEAQAPDDVDTFTLFTGHRSLSNIARYERAGYARTGPASAGVVTLSKARAAVAPVRTSSVAPVSSGLVDALRVLRGGRWVDLTHSFSAGIPHYAKFPDETRMVVSDYSKGFLVHFYGHVGQWGTHVDPPAHFIEGGRTLDQIAVNEMLLELVVLDAVDRVAADPDYVVDLDLIAAHEDVHGPIPAGSFVAFRSGWSSRWPSGDAMQNRDADGIAHYPGWGVEALRFLVEERFICAVGHEQTDTDPGTELSAGRVDAERYLLGTDRWQIEMLANLDRVPERGAVLLVSWPKPHEGSGFPARCVAIAPE